jgi:deoxyribodipyrimidine photo-lyase
MRELNTTGYMHNRGRLIVSSFLTKTLLLDWREGERYFAKKLTDYDPASNNGNWQWTASTGVDSQPYFRIFNPWSQSEQYDAKATYIKKWVPELRDVDAKTIHNEDKMMAEKIAGYPKPIVDYTEQKEKALRLYKDAY